MTILRVSSVVVKGKPLLREIPLNCKLRPELPTFNKLSSINERHKVYMYYVGRCRDIRIFIGVHI